MTTYDDTYGALYQITTLPPNGDGTIALVSSAIQQTRRLPGGSGYNLLINYEATQPITLEGYTSLKPSHVRPLQGPGVSNGRLVLTGTGSVRVVLNATHWTVQP